MYITCSIFPTMSVDTLPEKLAKELPTILKIIQVKGEVLRLYQMNLPLLKRLEQSMPFKILFFTKKSINE